MKVNGLDKTLRKLAKFGEEADRKVIAVTMVTAQEIATDATQRAPGGKTGKLRQSINASQETPYKWWVNVNIVYGAYVEFGTGTNVEVPQEWKDLAWSYYVNGQGFMHPQPFLYPAYRKGIKQYEADLKDLLDSLTRKFNQ